MAIRLNRRAMIRGAGGVALGLPLLDAMRAKGQGTVPKRFVVVSTHNGVAQETYAMSGTETNFQLSETLAPLERHKQDILFFQGVDNQVARIGNPDHAHERGTNCVLTGGLGRVNDEGAPENFHGPSVDQAMAQALNLPTKFRSLELGVGGDVRFSRRTGLAGVPVASSADQPLLPDGNPGSVFDRVFADVQSSGSEPPVLPIFDRVREGNRSVLDFTRARIAKLSARLGAEDRIRLDQHLTAVRELEGTLQVPVQTIGCERPERSLIEAYAEDSALPQVMQAMFSLTAHAFACDLTRIVSITSLNSNLSHSFAGESGAWHNDVSHRAQGNRDTDGYISGVTKINKWYTEQFATFFDMLKSIPEGDSTVFDNTAFLWVQDVSMGSTHRQTNMPFIVAGSCGGYFKTGRLMQYNGESHNKLLVSLLNAMGVQTSEFGLPGYSGGPLANLTA